ncbi:MAG: hypothetical protein ACE5JX_23275, partial [Acidobacteriota bacterium]
MSHCKSLQGKKTVEVSKEDLLLTDLVNRERVQYISLLLPDTSMPTAREKRGIRTEEEPIRP